MRRRFFFQPIRPIDNFLVAVSRTSVLALLLLTAGCDGTEIRGSASDDAGRSTLCDAPAILKSCHLGCHVGVFPPDLTIDPIESSMIGVPAGLLSGPCAGMPLIDTTDRAASVLLKKIMGSTCGEQMPTPPLAQLPAADIACVTDWVMRL